MSEAVNDFKTFARNAKGVRELLSMKFDTLPFEGEWYDAFGTPESRGVWIVWGKSGSGKTSFVMKLCKELCKYGRVVYDSPGGRYQLDHAEHRTTQQHAGGEPPFSVGL